MVCVIERPRRGPAIVHGPFPESEAKAVARRLADESPESSLQVLRDNRKPDDKTPGVVAFKSCHPMPLTMDQILPHELPRLGFVATCEPGAYVERGHLAYLPMPTGDGDTVYRLVRVVRSGGVCTVERLDNKRILNNVSAKLLHVVIAF